jgi:hypothetical protein
MTRQEKKKTGEFFFTSKNNKFTTAEMDSLLHRHNGKGIYRSQISILLQMEKMVPVVSLLQTYLQK